MIRIADLIVPVTAAQQEETFLKTLEGVGLNPRAWRKGGSLRTILYIVAVALAGLSNLIAAFAGSGFLDTSTGGWLTLLAYSVYGVTRIPATFATGSVTLTNSGGGNYPVAANAFTCSNPATGATYTNVSSFVLSPGATLVVPVIASAIGSASSSSPGTVTKIVSAMILVSCTNPAAIVGVDAELDAVLAQRCRDKLGTLSGLGPRGAYGYAVRSATRPDGSIVNINRLAISPSSSTGVVTIYVASPTGAPLSSDISSVQASIETYARPDSVTANVFAANPLPIAKTLTVWAVAQVGVSATDLAGFVNNALIALTSSYPIGGIAKAPATQGYLFATRLEGAVVGAHPSIFAVDGVGGDTLMNPGDVAPLTATLTIRIVTKAAS